MNIGEMTLQGPHHSAEKSTMATPFCARAASHSALLWISVTPILAAVVEKDWYRRVVDLDSGLRDVVVSSVRRRADICAGEVVEGWR